MRKKVSDTTDFARNTEWRTPSESEPGPIKAAPVKVPVFQTSKPAAPEYNVYSNPTADRAGSSHSPSRPLGGKLKRVLDILIAAVALIAALPLMLIVATVLKLSGGPVFFIHDRVGFKGMTFGCLKFRTMVQNPDKALRDYLAANPEANAEWEQCQKLRKDPRITFFGHALRRASIDELPQLINILRGDMSCVGPRPVTTEELGRYGEQASLYLQTRPGLTGLWQTSGRNRLSYEERVVLDSTYVREWSLLLDLKILLKTIFAVIRTDETS